MYVCVCFPKAVRTNVEEISSGDDKKFLQFVH